MTNYIRQRAPIALILALLAAGLPLASQPMAPQAPGQPPAAAAPAPEALPAEPITDPYGTASPETKAAVQAAQDLAGTGAWRKAWDALEAYDPKSADAYVLAARINLVLEGYVQTDLHRSFALVDLAAGQTVAALRAQGGQGEVFEFDPLTVIQGLENAGTELPPVLLEAFGDYCYEVQSLYGDKWVASEEEVCTMGITCYDGAVHAGLSSARSLLRRGELLLRFNRTEEAVDSIKASLEKEPGSFAARRTLALAYAQEEKADEALALMDALIPEAAEGDQRFEAYMLAANIAAIDGPWRAEAYLAAAEKAYPGEPGPALLRHQFAIKEADTSIAQVEADKALDRFPNSPYVVRNLLTSWFQADKLPEAREFLDRNLSRRGVKQATQGILLFYKAIVVAQVKGPEFYPEALGLLDQAEKAFTATYPEGDQVFEAIAQLRAQFAAEGTVPEAEDEALPAEGAEGAAPADEGGVDSTSGASSGG